MDQGRRRGAGVAADAAGEAVGGERPFEYEQDAPLTIGNYVRDSQTTYIVTRILPDQGARGDRLRCHL